MTAFLTKKYIPFSLISISFLLFIFFCMILFFIYTKIFVVPDLVFYYSDDNTVSNYSKLHFGSTLIINISGNITDKSITNKHYKVIGYFTEYKMCNPTINNSAYVTNIETFHLENGSILLEPIGIQPKNFQGNYSIPSNTTLTFKMISGTEKYVNSKGYVTLQTYDNLERKVSIYFD